MFGIKIEAFISNRALLIYAALWSREEAAETHGTFVYQNKKICRLPV